MAAFRARHGLRATAHRVGAGQDGFRTAAGALDRFEAAHALDPEAAWPVHVALDEVLSNVVRHGRPAAQTRSST